jgi:hypothetical protein
MMVVDIRDLALPKSHGYEPMCRAFLGVERERLKWL